MQGNRLISSIGAVAKDGKFSVEISRPLFDETGNQTLITLIVEPIDIEVALPRVKMTLEREELGRSRESRESQ